MNRTEWNEWHADLANRLPELATYIKGLSATQRDLWFDEIFSRHELRDAMALTVQLWESGDGVGRWDRDKLPSILIKRLADIAWARSDREHRHKRERATSGAQRAVATDDQMGPMYRFVASKIREVVQRDGEYPSNDTIRGWVAEASAKFDSAADDEQAGPRVRCLTCQDTGYASKDENTVGCCSCDLGKKRFEAWSSAGKRIAYVTVGDGSYNPFNEALR